MSGSNRGEELPDECVQGEPSASATLLPPALALPLHAQPGAACDEGKHGAESTCIGASPSRASSSPSRASDASHASHASGRGSTGGGRGDMEGTNWWGSRKGYGLRYEEAPRWLRPVLLPPLTLPLLLAQLLLA